MPRIVPIAVIMGLAAAAGCTFGKKPYANDPLIKANRAVWGDRDRAQLPPPPSEPPTLPAPSGPLLGSEATLLP